MKIWYNLGDVKGDPHVRVNSKGQQSVCFDITAVDQSILDFISDPNTGLEVNGQLFCEGNEHIRLERIFIRSPVGVEVEIQPGIIKYNRNNLDINFDINFDNHIEFGYKDMHVEILP